MFPFDRHSCCALCARVFSQESVPAYSTSTAVFCAATFPKPRRSVVSAPASLFVPVRLPKRDLDHRFPASCVPLVACSEHATHVRRYLICALQGPSQSAKTSSVKSLFERFGDHSPGDHGAQFEQIQVRSA